MKQTMKVAISSTGPGLDSEVDPRFGRCQYFIIGDTETMEHGVMDNSSAMAAGGAGISAAQAIVDKGVQALLTGNCGPNAYEVLSSAGINTLGERFRYRQGCRQDEGYKTRGRPRWGLCLPQLRRKNTPSGRHTLLWDRHLNRRTRSRSLMR